MSRTNFQSLFEILRLANQSKQRRSKCQTPKMQTFPIIIVKSQYAKTVCCLQSHRFSKMMIRNVEKCDFLTILVLFKSTLTLTHSFRVVNERILIVITIPDIN